MESQQKINLLRVRDFSENFNVIFEFSKQNYKNILKGICYVILGVFVVAFLTMGINTQVTDPYELLAIYTGWQMGLGSILSSLISIIISAFVICYMVQYNESENGIVSNSSVWSKATGVILPLIGYGIVYGVIVVIGCVLCLIPGIIVGVYLIFYSYIYVVERLSLVDTFKRSWELVTDNWFVTFGVVFIIAIAIFLINFLLGILLSSIGTIGAVFGTDFFMGDIYSYINTLIVNIVSTLLAPITTIAIGVLYYSRRADVDNIEIDQNIDNIGSIGNYE